MKAAFSTVDEVQRLDKLRSYAVLDTAREPVFDRVVFMTAQLFRVPIALIALIDEHRQWFKAQVGLSLTEISRDIAFCAHTILSDDVLVVEDATSDPRFAENPMVVGPPHIRFYAGAPLIAPGGHRVGSLCILDRQPRVLQPSQQLQLQQLARSVVQMLEVHMPTGDPSA